LAVLLAGGAGLLIRSVINLRAIDPGLTAEGVVIADVMLPTQLSHDHRRRAILNAVPALQGVPGVRAVAAAMKLPLRGSGQNWGIAIPGKPELPNTTTAFRVVTRDYFTALNIRVVRGRAFSAGDREHTVRVVVIDEALAAKYFAGENPLGRTISTDFDARGERIIRVVASVPEATLTDALVPARYMLCSTNKSPSSGTRSRLSWLRRDPTRYRGCSTSRGTRFNGRCNNSHSSG
jgi:hypothetical protein